VTNPFDVIKTRRQASARTGGDVRTVHLLTEIVKREGLVGLGRGLAPRLAKVMPACGIMIGAYELGLKSSLR
jgi:solute carrier family 25 protein 39/40